MSSPNVGSEQTGSTESSLSIQKIVNTISDLHDILAKHKVAEADSAQQTTVGTNTTAANNQTANQQDGSNSGDVSQGNSNDTNKQDAGDVSQEKQEGVAQEMKNTGSSKKGRDIAVQEKTDENKEWKEVQHELDKLSKELQYMIRSFQKLEKFETDLKEPLKTLEANVNDITTDLPQVKLGGSAKQVQVNLRVLRNNITRVKIQIPLQHQTANTTSDANRALQTTVATREAEDLPHLFNQEILERSYYFKEIEEKYKKLGIREKLCLFCFSIFPENAEIKKRLLRFWWVGENLVPAENPEKEKELVNEILETFLKNGFIHPVRKKNKLQPRSYTMSPIVRSCLIKFAKEKRFFDYDKEGKPTMDFTYCKKACMVKSQGIPVGWFSDYLKEPAAGTKTETESTAGKKGEMEPTEGTKTETTEPAAETKTKQAEGTKSGTAAGTKRLPADLVKLQMLFNFPDRDTLEETSRRFDKLQTLFNISKQFPALPKEWLSKMTGIKVLYLGRWESSAGRQRHVEVEDTDFLKGFKSMKKLRILSLQGISGITKLSSTICKLENLRILDLRACHNLEKLPERIGLLTKLTYLDLSECYLLDEMPKQLSKLSELQVLKGFVISSVKTSCTLDDLSELGNLRKLSVNVNTTEFNIDVAGKALSKFKTLEKLKIAWGSGGLKENNSTQDSSEQQSDPSNPSGGKGKKQEKDTSKSETKKQAAKSSGEKENKGEDKGDNNELKSGEANSKTMNQKKRPGLATAINKVVFANRLWQAKKRKDLHGLERLVKLDLQCFPHFEPPEWLVPENMISLTNLCIRGGRVGYLIHSDVVQWKVEILRLKYLMDFKMNWKEVRERFKKLNYLEKVRCPRITFCPCDANGVWQKSSENV
ncbi:hypothetical protein DITRI_Ditri07aG0177000 [Diplodiscus trichospermus]